MQLKEFWEQNGRFVIRLYLNQIVMSVFGLMVISAAVASENNNLIFLASLAAVGLYLYIIYFMMWEAGAKAAAKRLNAEEAGVKKIETPLLITAFGSLLNTALYLVYTIIYIYVSANNITNIQHGAASYGNLIELIIKMINAMYMGFADLLFPNPNYELFMSGEETISIIMHTPPYYFFLTLVPLFVTAVTAYYLGGSEVSILRKLGFKQSNKKISNTDIDYKKNNK